MSSEPIKVVSLASANNPVDRINMSTGIDKPFETQISTSVTAVTAANTVAATAGTAELVTCDIPDLDKDLDDEAYSQYHYNYASALDGVSEENVGLTCLPIQKKTQTFRKGVNFTIMVVGESGVGKTSFINTLFDSKLIESDITSSAADLSEDELQIHLPAGNSFEKKTTRITPYRMDLIENNFKMRCTVIDTPGFGDYIDNKYCWYPITRYIDEQYRKLVYQETQPNRSTLVHSEVHVCLYFIKPTAVGLTILDIEALKNLASRVNLVPIISKADGFTDNELSSFKQKIRESLKINGIECCQFVRDSKTAEDMISRMPFSIINSTDCYKNEDKGLVRARKYSWGLAEVENPDHCDFLMLRAFLMGSHMGDLILSTENYYEKYRRDFMRFRLGISVQKVLATPELEALGLEVKEYPTNVNSFNNTTPRSKSSWKSATLREAKAGAVESRISSQSLDQLTNSQDAVTVLKLMDKFSLTSTEKELVLLNPAYLDLEKYVKQKFTADVRKENIRFKSWKRALFERQDKFNRDIDQIHDRVHRLQQEIKKLGGEEP
ncbi:hypothetical protein FOA43_002790 [Brettanomyces nanus]|uniref:Septin-type G domain-containing protein n=1 Tax=Eeniella nana TaxID=13502 RepID=A0A875S271_EENNA|nr:uncharacterized protein FOA43_002790 [Brettanomyces nanus]QPG75436.1 hypothetical protein FOA43_002790 [Brettanomyces nanus]